MKVLLIPFDQGIMDPDRRGAKEAPKILSKELEAEFKNVQVSEDLNILHKNIYEAAKIQLEQQGKVLTIGGDHSITPSIVKAAKEKYEDVGYLCFDAHPDCQDDFLPGGHDDITIAISKMLPKENILLVGVRKFTDRERSFINNKDIKIVKVGDLNSISGKVQDFCNKFKHLYVSLDIDVVDLKYAPGTGWPEKRGVSREEIIALSKQIAKQQNLVGFDLVEVSPPFDKENKTVQLSISIFKQFLLQPDNENFI